MTVDYLQRKRSKKLGKQAAEKLKPRRERKKNQPRRLCRGPCFKQPVLTPDDVEGGEGGRAPRALHQVGKKPASAADATPAASQGVGEIAKYAHLLKFVDPGGAANGSKAAAGGKGGSKGSSKGDAQEAGSGSKQKRKAVPAAEAADADAVSGAAAATGGGRKRPKLSTAVSLLHPAGQGSAAGKRPSAAAAAAPPGDAASPELAGLPPIVQAYMAAAGFTEPTPIQAQAWPLLLAGKDVEAVAEPGSGKTLAYLLPAAALLVARSHGAGTRPKGPLVLILAPTRELAQQVAAAASAQALRRAGLRCSCVHGGSEVGQQAADLAEASPHVLVATPGRLLDLVQSGLLSLEFVRYIVLDEADKMLGLGFQPQIQALRRLLLQPPVDEGPGEGGDAGAAQQRQQEAKKSKKKKQGSTATAAAAVAVAEDAGEDGEVGALKQQQQQHKAKKRQWRRPQVALLTATMPDELASVAADWLHTPERLRISHSAASISRTVMQVVQVCAEHKKLTKLRKHLGQVREASRALRNPPRILIFANRVKTVRFLHGELSSDGLRAAMLHGERSQAEREEAIAAFRSGKAQVLVATDVAARGLHIRGLPYVVNYDFPPNLETYIHRVGRTGRLAANGHAFSFFTREMARLAPPLLDLLVAHDQAVDPNLVKLAEAFKIAAAKLGLPTDGSALPAGEEGAGGSGSEGEAEECEEGGEGSQEGQEGAAPGRQAKATAVAGASAAAVPRKEDVLRELGLKSAQQKKQEKRRQQKQQHKAHQQQGVTASDSGGSGSEEEGADASRAGATASQQRKHRPAEQDREEEAAAAGGLVARPAFIPARSFNGAMPGYAFKKGPQGLGYYLDAHQQRQKGGKSGKAGTKARAGSGARQRQREEFQQLKAKYSHKPIGGPEAGSKQAKQAQQQQEAAKPTPKLLPGKLRELRRQKDRAVAAQAVGGLLDAAGFGSSSEDEAPPASAGRRAAVKQKALPGRLRKKLAKQKQQQKVNV